MFTYKVLITIIKEIKNTETRKYIYVMRIKLPRFVEILVIYMV